MFNQGHIGGDLNPQTHKTGTGGMLDGVLRTYGAFNEHALSVRRQPGQLGSLPLCLALR